MGGLDSGRAYRAASGLRIFGLNWARPDSGLSGPDWVELFFFKCIIFSLFNVIDT